MESELSGISEHKVAAIIGIASLSLLCLGTYFYEAWGIGAIILIVLSTIMVVFAALLWGIALLNMNPGGMFSVDLGDGDEYEDEDKG